MTTVITKILISPAAIATRILEFLSRTMLESLFITGLRLLPIPSFLALCGIKIYGKFRERLKRLSPKYGEPWEPVLNGLLFRQVLATPMVGSNTCDVRRTLNPAFVEALMGWPTGWTGFAFAATAWFHWLRPMRCELWQLNCWPMAEVA